jgi:hypothetical protein
MRLINSHNRAIVLLLATACRIMDMDSRAWWNLGMQQVKELESEEGTMVGRRRHYQHASLVAEVEVGVEDIRRVWADHGCKLHQTLGRLSQYTGNGTQHFIIV